MDESVHFLNFALTMRGCNLLFDSRYFGKDYIYPTLFTDRIEGNVIYVGEQSGWQNQKECARITSTDRIQTVSCRTDKPVRYLTIRHQTQSALTFCEVVVNGYKYQGKVSRQMYGWHISKYVVDKQIL